MLSAISSIGRKFFYLNQALTDIFSTKNNYIIQVELPGVKREDIQIDCESGVLDVTAIRKEELPKDAERVLSEREYGKFTRSFQLPRSIDTSKIDARFVDGVLSIDIPRSTSSKIEIKVQ